MGPPAVVLGWSPPGVAGPPRPRAGGFRPPESEDGHRRAPAVLALAATALAGSGTASGHTPTGRPSGRTRIAPPPRVRRVAAASSSTTCVSTGTEGFGSARRQAAPDPSVSRFRPGPSRSRVEMRAPLRRSQACGIRPPRSADSPSTTSRRLPSGSADRAVLCRPTGRRSVWYEPSSFRPAAQHPAEPPGEVESVVDGGVHAGATTRG
jgi:hypothetical protein